MEKLKIRSTNEQSERWKNREKKNVILTEQQIGKNLTKNL